MKPYKYQLKNFSNFDVGGYEGTGFSYTYQVQDINMQGTSVVSNKDNTFWHIHAYYQQSNEKDDLELITDCLKNITWN